MDPPDHEHDDSSPAPGSHSTVDEAGSNAPGAPVTQVAVASPPSAESPTPEAPDARDAGAPDPADTLSPAVRRLVRQYDLDITGIHGTGPAGKIRVGDVIGMLGGRAEPSARAGDAAPGTAGPSNATPAAFVTRGERDDTREADSRPLPDASEPAVQAARTTPATTVFECDLSNVLSHRKRDRRGDAEILLTSYFVAACSEALRAVPELGERAADSGPRTAVGADTWVAPALGVLLATGDGSVRRTLVAVSEPALDGRLRAIDRQLRASGDDDLHAARLLIHHYGPSGSLLATPTPLGAGHTASVGIGRVRKEIVVRAVDGEEAPRVAALCFVTLTFLPEHVTLERANRFVAELVRVLEQWTPPASAQGRSA
jgi:2-oxoglutarate dehydrogenase E2 component (dihydrolipoamide succinyltransferase)